MKFWKRAAAILICALLGAPAVPSLAEGTVAAWVDGAPVSRSLLDARISAASAAGIAGDGAAREELRAKVLEDLVREQALLNEAGRRGIRLEGEMEDEARRRYEKTIASVERYVLAGYPGLEGEELDQTVDAMLAGMGESRESYREAAERLTILDALDEALFAECPAPPEEEIRARYDALLAEQRKRFADQDEFERAMLRGEAVVHRPRDLKRIQIAEFRFDELALQLIASAREDDPDAAVVMLLDQYQLLAEKVEPIYEDLTAGRRSFADVLEELEPGSSKEFEYFHPDSTRFSADYYQRAQAFTGAGELSTAVVLPTGYALLYCDGEIPACDAVPYAQAREAVAAELREDGRAEYLERRREEICAAARVEYPPEGEE